MSDKRIYHDKSEIMTNNSLHIAIRELTDIANKECSDYYCSHCGESFENPHSRSMHTDIHSKEYALPMRNCKKEKL